MRDTREGGHMRIDFTKMQGTGNDFIFIEDARNEIELTSDEVKFLCDRHFGIGADGVILVRSSENPDCVAYMHYINSDGSLAQMCGNGVRCFAKYLVDHRMVALEQNDFIVDTLSGPKPISIKRDETGYMSFATVDMGEPIFSAEKIPTTLAHTDTDSVLGDVVTDAVITTPGGDLRFTCVSMGNPHAIAFIDDPLSFDLQTVGAFIESHPAFPEKTNAEFAKVLSLGEEARIVMRVFERGCGETLACGTGCCATAVAAALTGRAPRKVILQILGGELEIEWASNNHVIMTGPAATVYTGSLELNRAKG